MSHSRADQAEATRQAALAAARTLFVRQGYDATSLQAIADEMGVTKANVYYYFRTKAGHPRGAAHPDGRRPGPAPRRGRGAAGRSRPGRADDDRLRRPGHRRPPESRDGEPRRPGLRRDLAIARRLEALSHRGLRLLHGEHPTPDQEAGYWLAQDLGPVLRRLTGLDDDTLRDVLTGSAGGCGWRPPPDGAHPQTTDLLPDRRGRRQAGPGRLTYAGWRHSRHTRAVRARTERLPRCALTSVLTREREDTPEPEREPDEQRPVATAATATPWWRRFEVWFPLAVFAASRVFTVIVVLICQRSQRAARAQRDPADHVPDRRRRATGW